MHQCNAASTWTVTSPARFVTGAIRHLARMRRQFGNRAVLQWLVDRVARRLIHFQVDNLVCFDVDRLGEPPPIEPGLTFRFLTPAEVLTFASDPANEIERTMAQRALAAQDLCFGVIAEGRLAGYGWCAFDFIDPQHCGGLAMSCPPHVAYLYKGFTRPEFRGKRLNGVRVLLAGRELAKRGIRKLVGLVDWTNWSSMRSSVVAGGTSLGRLVTIGLGRYRWTFYPKAAREIGIQFGRHAMSTPESKLASL